jgi:hypothetical protein
MDVDKRIGERLANNEFYRPRSAMFCHPERELRVSRDGQTDASRGEA